IDPCPNIGLVDGSVPQHEPVAVERALGVKRERRRHHLALLKSRGHGLIVKVVLEKDSQVQAGFVGTDVQLIAHLRLQRLDEDRLPLGIERAHPSQVAFEVAFFEEVGHDHLGGEGRASFQQGLGGGKRLDQRLGHHEVAEAESGEQHLAKGADVDDPARVVEPLEGGDGTPFVAVLAVVVVLQNPRLRAFGPVQQRQSPGQAHRHAEGILVRWGHVGQARLRRVRAGPVEGKAFVVERDGNRLRPGPAKGALGPRIARIFDPGAVAGIKQHVGRERDGLLRARDDDNLFGRTVNAPRLLEVRRDGLAERWVARRLAVAQRGGGKAAPAPAGELAPQLNRKRVEGREAGTKRTRLFVGPEGR
ncbi:MAG: hypothetical protein BRD26_08840, partial [Bacteroidetes bacterium QH_1_64_81]